MNEKESKVCWKVIKNESFDMVEFIDAYEGTLEAEK